MDVLAFLKNKYKAQTAASYHRAWLNFLNFLFSLNLTAEMVSHQLILDYVNQLKNKGLLPKSINRRLMIIEQIYEELERPKVNPVKGLRLKTAKENPLPQPIDYKLLSQYLSDFEPKNTSQLQQKLILSLIHYQALRGAEIKALKTTDLNFKQAQIQIPSVLRSNSRTLELTALQTLDFQNFIENHRPLIPSNETQLFLGMQGSKNLSNLFKTLQVNINRTFEQLQNLEHWRTSVIMHWLEKESLLDVQARLGHRFASSTERYKIHSIKSLADDLAQHHPLS